MIFDVEIVLRERDYAVTERVEVPVSEAGDGPWSDQEVELILKAILLAIDRVRNPQAESRYVALRGLSWIVEPIAERRVVIAIEIPSGAAVAGPFAVEQAVLDRSIARVLAAASPLRPSVH
jgi:hypothetical protein